MFEYSDKISIETSQNVRLEYEVASVGDRILAWLIDTAFNLFFVLLVYFFLDITDALNALDSTARIYVGVAIFLPWIFYHLLCEIFMEGQSIGKKFRKIKVVKVDGSEARMGDFIIRWFTRLLENLVFPGLSLVAVLASVKGQRLGDRAAGTAVAKMNQRVKLTDTILHYTEENYTPLYPGVQNLSARDIEVIKFVLNTKTQSNRYFILSECTQKVIGLIGLENVKVYEYESFLKQVLDDYTYYASKEL